jgi:hypothetical protein
MATLKRVFIDCRDYPSESNCSLLIVGTEEEVLEAASDHAVKKHGHKKGPKLRAMLKKAFKKAR